MEVTLKKERPVLTVNVGDEQVKVPLTFNRVEFGELGNAEDKENAMDGFFERYLGEVYWQLGDDDITALYKAWTHARAKIGAPDMGEPSASPK